MATFTEQQCKDLAALFTSVAQKAQDIGRMNAGDQATIDANIKRRQQYGPFTGPDQNVAEIVGMSGKLFHDATTLSQYFAVIADVIDFQG